MNSRLIAKDSEDAVFKKELLGSLISKLKHPKQLLIPSQSPEFQNSSRLVTRSRNQIGIPPLQTPEKGSDTRNDRDSSKSSNYMSVFERIMKKKQNHEELSKVIKIQVPDSSMGSLRGLLQAMKPNSARLTNHSGYSLGNIVGSLLKQVTY
jgi:hypothetical protein